MQSIPWDQLMKQAESAGGGDPLPTNKYLVEVVSAEAKQTANGKPMLKVKAKVAGGPHDGRTVWTNMTLSADNDMAVAIFMRHMAAFGLTKEYFATMPPFEKVGIDLVGRQATFDVGQKTYNGELRNEVNNILAAGAAGGIQPGPVPQVAAPTPVPQVPVAPAPAPAPAPTPQVAPAPEQQYVVPPAPPVPAPVAEAPAVAAPVPAKPPF